MFADTQKILKYDPETGHLIWLVDRKNGSKAGTRAGSIGARGYRQVTINGITYSEHRIAWLLMTGAFPKAGEEIDHINRMTGDNRWSNLRKVTHTQNMWNSTIKKSNTSGQMGVHWKPSINRWQARYYVDGKRVSLGCFKTKEAAIEAYNTLAKTARGEYYVEGK